MQNYRSEKCMMSMAVLHYCVDETLETQTSGNKIDNKQLLEFKIVRIKNI